MIPATVAYTGLEFDPVILRDRCIKGVIPPDWQRYSFLIDIHVSYPVGKVNRWLQNNIDGSWAIYCDFVSNHRKIYIAFEHDSDAMTFVLADGKTEAFREPTL